MEYVAAIASVPAIIALVNFCKTLGVKGNASLVLAVAFGVGLNIANFYLADIGAYQAGVTGLITGLSAAGVYDIASGGKSDTVGVDI